VRKEKEKKKFEIGNSEKGKREKKKQRFGE
jgi:hypothetical protein